MKLLRYLPLLVVMLLSGCVKNEITISFDLPQSMNSPCRMMYYMAAKNAGEYREVMAEIIAGKGEVKLPERYPSLIYLFSQSQQMPAAIIYASRGDKISVTGKEAAVDSWEISGNETTESLTAWRLRNKNIIASRESEALDKAVTQFVEKNPSSKAAVIILYVYYNRRDNMKGFLDLQAKLDRKLLEDPDLMRALSSADMLGEISASDRLPSEWVLLGEDGYADTLSLKKGEKALLIFRNSKKDGGINADSLKSLASSSPEGRVVELYADSDSLGWRRHIKNDTIPGLRRDWLPLGVQDSVAMQLGVTRIPYIIVIDSNRKKTYQGDTWSDAVKNFKK